MCVQCKNTAGAALTLHNIAEGQAEALEFVVDEKTRYIGTPLREMKTKANVLLVFISHGSKTEIPSGDSMYQKGDSLKLVHWKLTARLNDLMVKEMMEPTEKLTWLYLNLQESPDLPAVRGKPEAWDHFVETVSSISAMLLKMEKRHMVLWIDSQSSRLERNSVSDEQSLQEMLCGLLRTDTFLPKDFSPLLKENNLDETKGTCIEIDLQGNFARAKTPG